MLLEETIQCSTNFASTPHCLGECLLPSLFLADRGPIDCIPARCDILDLEGDDIAATQLLVQHEDWFARCVCARRRA